MDAVPRAYEAETELFDFICIKQSDLDLAEFHNYSYKFTITQLYAWILRKNAKTFCNYRLASKASTNGQECKSHVENL